MKNTPLFLSALIGFCCACYQPAHPKPSIIKLPAYSWIDTVKTAPAAISSRDAYLIIADRSDTSAIRQEVDRFARKENKEVPCRFTNCVMDFYIASDSPVDKRVASVKNIHQNGLKAYELFYQYHWIRDSVMISAPYDPNAAFDPGTTTYYFNSTDPSETTVTGKAANFTPAFASYAVVVVGDSIGFHVISDSLYADQDGKSAWKEDMVGKTVTVAGLLWIVKTDPPRPGKPMVQGAFGTSILLLHAHTLTPAQGSGRLPLKIVREF